MKPLKLIVPRWLPSFLLMVLIFLFSSRHGEQLPDYGNWDYFIKKSVHAIGYGLLALSYLHALPKKNYVLAWILALLYSATDEFHQSFVPGRHASIVDVLIFDNIGAIIALIFYYSKGKHDSKNNQT